MKQIYPDFYPEFRCLAGKCPDTCCKDWEVVVDPEAMEFYQSVPGALGERLKNGFVEQDGDICFRLENGKCTFLTEDGLCELQKTYGEKGLCRICASHPRFLEEYGDAGDHAFHLLPGGGASAALQAGADLLPDAGDGRSGRYAECARPGALFYAAQRA